MAEYDPDKLHQAAKLFSAFYVQGELEDRRRVANAQPILAQLRTTREHLQRLVEQVDATIQHFDYRRDETLSKFFYGLGALMDLDRDTVDEIISQHISDVQDAAEVDWLDR